VSAAKRTAISTIDENGTDRHMWYTGVEYNFNARVGHGITLFGGGTMERTIAQVCDEQANPNLLLYCDQTKSGIPFRTQFKIAGTVPLNYGIAVSVSFQSLPGYRFGTAALNIDTGIVAGPSGQPGATSLANPNGQGSVWLITPTTRYTVCPGSSASQGCVVGAKVVPGTLFLASLPVPLIAPGTEMTPRVSQLDVSISKRITFGNFKLDPKIDLFNALNSDDYYSVRTTTFAPVSNPALATGFNGSGGTYLQPQSILQGRLLRIAVVVNW